MNSVGVSDPRKADNVEQVAGAQTESVNPDVELDVGAQTEEASVDPNKKDDQTGVRNPGDDQTGVRNPGNDQTGVQYPGRTDRGFDKTGKVQSLSLNTKDNQGVGYYEDRSVKSLTQ